MQEMVEVEFLEPMPADARKLVYARSAYRHEPDFSQTTISRTGDVFDAPRAVRMIDPESKVSDNYRRLVSATMDDVFLGRTDALTGKQIREQRIGGIRDALLQLFPDLELQGPGDPLNGGTFFFRKGGKEQFHYKNLSGGEKAAFDLLLDLVIATTGYDDTVFCIDEPELHISTRTQGALLDALLRLLPANGQLWIATHSIGMLRAAHRMHAASPDSVAFVDFEDRAAEGAVVLAPTPPDRKFWARVFTVALDELAELVAPDCIVLCEGRPDGPGAGGASEFDARCYRQIFANEFPRTDFVSVGNASDVKNDRLELGRTIQTLVAGTRVVRLIDRDMRTHGEVDELQKQGVRVLPRRHLESFLLDEELIGSLADQHGQAEKSDVLLRARAEAIAESVAKGSDKDNMKDAAGYFYVKARRILSLTGGGSTTSAFLADTMAPLLKPGTRAYAELRDAIFV